MSHAGSAQNIPKKTRFRLDKNVADAKLENTSLSTDVFQGVPRGYDSCGRHPGFERTAASFIKL